MNTCTILGCEKPGRTKSAELCKMHYHRQYRNGTAGEATERKRKQRSQHCEVNDCAKPDTEGGMCSMHAARKRRHGDPLMVIALQDRDMPSGEQHPNWVGSDIGYSGAHCRVKSMHGSASTFRCVDCSGQARHWSYNHSDPNELITYERTANGIAYSDNPEHYSPRCVQCHKVFDLGRKNSSVLAST